MLGWPSALKSRGNEMSENNNARFLVARLELPVAILPIFLFVRKTTVTERERERERNLCDNCDEPNIFLE